MTRSAAIAGVGSALGSRVVTNHELARSVDTSDEWIADRTGIRERRFAEPDETTSSLAAAAAARALDAAGLRPDDVDLTLVATVSGDRPLPSTASYVQARLGISGAAFDLAAGCAGFVYGLATASALVRTGQSETALVVGAEVLSRFLDMTDRTTCVLFGDGAGAALVTPATESGVLASILENDGRAADLLRIPAGGSASPASSGTISDHAHTIRMDDGRLVFRRAVVAMAAACERALEEAKVTAEEVALVVPHQANARIVHAVAERLGFPPERVVVDIERVGNTSAASIPIALDRAWRSGRLRPGDLVLTAAFGAGLAWGANVIRWTLPAPEAAP